MVDKITTYRKQNKIKMRKMKHKECCGFTVSTTSNPYPQMHLSSSTSTLLLLLLLLSCFSRVQLCATPQTAVHQAPPSLGFSSQERWSGLPFPSPMHESEKVKVKSLSHVRLFATLWTAAHQAPPSMGFSRQEYWSGVPSPSPSTLLSNTQ